MSNPFDEFVQEFLPAGEKVAFGFGEAARGMAHGVAGGVGAAGAAAIVGVAGIAAGKVYQAATKSRDFRGMLAYNQDLQEHHDRDPRVFNQMFSSLRSMNPEYSGDPIVAGSYMRRMLESPHTAGGILTESLSTRDKFYPFHTALEEGMSSAGKNVRFGKKPGKDEDD